MSVQIAIPFRANPKEDITDQIVTQKKTLKQALKLCIEVSGLDDKELRFHFLTSGGKEIDKGNWSRMFNDDDSLSFPTNEIGKLMDLCGNLIPLRWLALKYGFELKPLKSALELELEHTKAALEKKEHELEVIKDFMKDIKK